jgi:hypothetical protein
LPSSEQSKKFEGPLGIALSVKLLSDSSTMYKATYQRNFRAATECAVTFARDHVINVVPEGRLFLIYTNQSHDGNPLRSDETLYPGDALPPKATHFLELKRRRSIPCGDSERFQNGSMWLLQELRKATPI